MHAIEHAYMAGQFTVAVSHASTPVHTTLHANPGGQSIDPLQAPLAQLIVQTCSVEQPPVQTAGQLAAPGGCGLEPHVTAPSARGPESNCEPSVDPSDGTAPSDAAPSDDV